VMLCWAMVLTMVCLPVALAEKPSHGPAVEISRHVEKILPPENKAAGETWSFAVTADTHVQYYDRTHNEKFAQLLNSWVKAKVDFAVIVGDLGGPGHHEPFGRQIARTANCPPILVAMGNHEMDRQGKKSWLNAVYPGVVKGEGKLNDRAFYYSVDYGGCHFVFLDGDRITGRKWFGDEISPDQLKWLAKDLQANRGKTTFIFSHHPVESSQQGKGVYLLRNRGRLVAILKRFPDVKWVFQGHLHYDERVRLWDINFVHVFRHRMAVRVKGKTVELCRITPKGLVPYRKDEWNYLGKRMAQRWSRRGDRDVLRIAEKAVEKDDAHARHGAGADAAIRPTRGATMLKLTRSASPGDSKAGRGIQIVLSNNEFIPVVKGMEFAYDVRFEGSTHDEVALHLHATFPDGRRGAALLDQNSLPMQAVKT
ncbi:hypothetical protein LCGC14_2747640, partial [marine sediment metagenome]